MKTINELQAEADGVIAMCNNLLEKLGGHAEVPPEVVMAAGTCMAQAIQAAALCQIALSADAMASIAGRITGPLRGKKQ